MRILRDRLTLLPTFWFRFLQVIAAPSPRRTSKLVKAYTRLGTSSKGQSMNRISKYNNKTKEKKPAVDLSDVASFYSVLNAGYEG